MDIMQKMQMKAPGLASSEEKVYHAIMKKPQIVELYTISMVAGIADTSTSAVLRFCQSLGYKGYKDFRYDMTQYLHSGKHSDLTAAGDPVSHIADLYSNSISALNSLDRLQIKRIAEDILSAEMVYLVGLHRSLLPAQKLKYNLEDYGILSVTAGDLIALGHLPFTINNESAVVIFSVSGDTVNYRTFFSSLSSTSPKNWLVTSNPNAKLRKKISDTIILPSANYDQNYPLDEHAVMMAFVEILSHTIRQMQLEN